MAGELKWRIRNVGPLGKGYLLTRLQSISLLAFESLPATVASFDLVEKLSYRVGLRHLFLELSSKDAASKPAHLYLSSREMSRKLGASKQYKSNLRRDSLLITCGFYLNWKFVCILGKFFE